MKTELKPQDLRIGNLVMYAGYTQCITELFSLSCGLESAEGNKVFINTDIAKYSELSPIPLTPDMLLRFGFVECYKSDFQTKYEWPSNPSMEYIFRAEGKKFFRWYGFDSNVEYCHNLQNIVYALTGKELTLKP